MAQETNFFNTWLQSQKKLFDGWVKATQSFQKAFFGSGGSEEAGNAAGSLFNLYQSWTKTMSEFFEDSLRHYPFGGGKENFSGADEGMNAYVKLFEIWEPFYETSLKNGFDAEAFKKMYDPAKYKEVIDVVFGFSSANRLADFYNQAAQVMKSWGAKTQHDFVQPWQEAAGKNLAEVPNLISGKPEAVMNIFNNMYNVYENNVNQAWNLTNIGADREKVELMMSSLDKLSGYLSKSTEFQHGMYLAGQQAMEKAMAAFSKQVGEGNMPKSFDEFFKLWSGVNEEIYARLFDSEGFSKLQSELLEKALDSRKSFGEFMELSMQDYPTPFRPELDDLYETVADLSKKVQALEGKLKSKPETKKGKS